MLAFQRRPIALIAEIASHLDMHQQSRANDQPFHMTLFNRALIIDDVVDFPAHPPVTSFVLKQLYGPAYRESRSSARVSSS